MKPTRFILLLTMVFIIQDCNYEKPHFTIYTIGDSTMADKRQEVYPETGWCQILGEYFDQGVIVSNHAVNGRSSKSFIDENRWQIVLDSLKAGDYVFIQFGHNDEKEYDSTRYTTPFGTYRQNLERFVNETRGRGATPVLFTPIVRRKFGDNGLLTDTHGDYPRSVREVADNMDVPLIDLQKLTEEWVNTLGEEASREYYLWTLPDDRYPDGRKDDTHLSLKGANQVAMLALKECTRLKLPFSERIITEKVTF
ncbi:MAG TPA: rhamnogalacturonan acetylesterase [Bacteroidales bacterium]|nr:rhamnogalacturonan acetylesterase [Bacteroidales bacterium]HPJ59781.1 rhamnogalacturonan acetylesterase [Bacteroidales bacterium]HPR12554.1 rhamnogalacturonan acetylesterase [Bacteroidales bacterium]HRW85237.1 rhamnogalacturonan acetylesterase [Bacteroidales bacterium]